LDGERTPARVYNSGRRDATSWIVAWAWALGLLVGGKPVGAVVLPGVSAGSLAVWGYEFCGCLICPAGHLLVRELPARMRRGQLGGDQ